jgi:hypothetical protein
MYNVGRAARLQAVRSGIRFPTRASYFSLFPNLHIGPRGLQKRPVWRVQPFSPGIKQPRHEVDHSHPSNAYVKNEWSRTSPSPIYIHGVHTNNLVTCYLTACMCRILISNNMTPITYGSTCGSLDSICRPLHNYNTAFRNPALLPSSGASMYGGHLR